MITYSDAYQDIFVLKLFKNTVGYYLDIGSSDGITKNNTLLLEQHGWSGLLFDFNEKHIHIAKQKRKSKAFIGDLSKPDILCNILDEQNFPKNIDYISLDIDEASLDCLKYFPLDKYRFKFLTFEHDIYAQRPDCIARKNETPVLLDKFGYVKLIDNVMYNGLPYEDWYIDPTYFDMNRFIDIINQTNLSYQEIYNRLR
jgi:hypothetical protein